MSKLGKYTVLCDAGFNGGATLPDAPSPENTTNSLRDAGATFRTWMRESGNDYHRADGYGAPVAWVYMTADYDGIAYGDNGVVAFERGPRGGIVRVNV
ncbi:hypothetical protein ACIA8K_12710 [Catenuloplanes sp. NPDC051500]|uniref:hypothetical protein n=1 Tax=Catenuloplanes sp. NPDC051500 TaxID=3363959 RepID=UPI0037A6D420